MIAEAAGHRRVTRARGHSARLLGCAAAALALAGCAGITRDAFTADDMARAALPGFGAIRGWGDAPPRTLARLLLPPRTPGHDVNLLALSGGGAGGAFAAGLLQGWTVAGTRPRFDVVTGVSTGALIAPFAFLGPAYDDTLQALYTGPVTAGLARRQPLVDILFGNGLMDPAPLRALVERYADAAMLEAVAAEYRRGRRLLVGTTNLDAQRPVIWDMTAVAASGRPDALSLFRDVLVASASIPAVYPPVMIKAQAPGRSLDEMHVDGGTAVQIFAPPDLFAPEGAMTPAQRRRVHLWLVVNNTLPPEFAVTGGTTLPIAARSLATFMKSQTLGIVTADAEAARRLGFDFNLAYIDEAVPYRADQPFDSAYMNRVFAIGADEARDGRVWHRSLEGLGVPAPEASAPVRTAGAD